MTSSSSSKKNNVDLDSNIVTTSRKHSRKSRAHVSGQRNIRTSSSKKFKKQNAEEKVDRKPAIKTNQQKGFWSTLMSVFTRTGEERQTSSPRASQTASPRGSANHHSSTRPSVRSHSASPRKSKARMEKKHKTRSLSPQESRHKQSFWKFSPSKKGIVSKSQGKSVKPISSSRQYVENPLSRAIIQPTDSSNIVLNTEQKTQNQRNSSFGFAKRAKTNPGISADVRRTQAKHAPIQPQEISVTVQSDDETRPSIFVRFRLVFCFILLCLGLFGGMFSGYLLTSNLTTSLSPPPILLAKPPAAPGFAVVQKVSASFVFEGTVETFNRKSFKDVLYLQFPNATDIILTVTPASVIVKADIIFASVEVAQSAETILISSTSEELNKIWTSYNTTFADKVLSTLDIKRDVTYISTSKPSPPPTPPKPSPPPPNQPPKVPPSPFLPKPPSPPPHPPPSPPPPSPLPPPPPSPLPPPPPSPLPPPSPSPLPPPPPSPPLPSPLPPPPPSPSSPPSPSPPPPPSPSSPPSPSPPPSISPSVDDGCDDLCEDDDDSSPPPPTDPYSPYYYYSNRRLSKRVLQEWSSMKPFTWREELLNTRLQSPSATTISNLVVSRFNENVDWVLDILKKLRNTKVYIYQKEGHPKPNICSLDSIDCSTIPNVGRESYTFLTHMVRYYNKTGASEKTTFCQGNAPTVGYIHPLHQGGHMTPDTDFTFDFVSPFTEPRIVPTYSRSVRGMTMSVRSDYEDAPLMKNINFKNEKVPLMCNPTHEWKSWTDNNNPWMGLLKDQPDQYSTTLQFWDRYFKPYFGNFLEDKFMFANGAVFSMSGKEWNSRPLSFYEDLLRTVDHYKDPVSGYHMEHLWGYLSGHKNILDDCSKKQITSSPF